MFEPVKDILPRAILQVKEPRTRFQIENEWRKSRRREMGIRRKHNAIKKPKQIYLSFPIKFLFCKGQSG